MFFLTNIVKAIATAGGLQLREMPKIDRLPDFIRSQTILPLDQKLTDTVFFMCSCLRVLPYLKYTNTYLSALAVISISLSQSHVLVKKDLVRLHVSTGNVTRVGAGVYEYLNPLLSYEAQLSRVDPNHPNRDLQDSCNLRCVLIFVSMITCLYLIYEIHVDNPNQLSAILLSEAGSMKDSVLSTSFAFFLKIRVDRWQPIKTVEVPVKATDVGDERDQGVSDNHRLTALRFTQS